MSRLKGNVESENLAGSPKCVKKSLVVYDEDSDEDDDKSDVGMSEEASVNVAANAEKLWKKVEGTCNNVCTNLENPWQLCYDESSGFPYYWNTLTNEVTWEKPVGYENVGTSTLPTVQLSKQISDKTMLPKSTACAPTTKSVGRKKYDERDNALRNGREIDSMDSLSSRPRKELCEYEAARGCAKSTAELPNDAKSTRITSISNSDALMRIAQYGSERTNVAANGSAHAQTETYSPHLPGAPIETTNTDQREQLYSNLSSNGTQMTAKAITMVDEMRLPKKDVTMKMTRPSIRINKDIIESTYSEDATKAMSLSVTRNSSDVLSLLSEKARKIGSNSACKPSLDLVVDEFLKEIENEQLPPYSLVNPFSKTGQSITNEKASLPTKIISDNAESNADVLFLLTEKARKITVEDENSSDPPSVVVTKNVDEILMQIENEHPPDYASTESKSKNARDKCVDDDVSKISTASQTEDIVGETTNQMQRDNEELRKEAETVMDKLSFIVKRKGAVTPEQVMAIQVELLVCAWIAGALETTYLQDWLRQSDLHLKQFEENEAPNGWICEWNKRQKKYYFRHAQSGEKRYYFPRDENTQMQRDSDGNEQFSPHQTLPVFSQSAQPPLPLMPPPPPPPPPSCSPPPLPPLPSPPRPSLISHQYDTDDSDDSNDSVSHEKPSSSQMVSEDFRNATCEPQASTAVAKEGANNLLKELDSFYSDIAALTPEPQPPTLTPPPQPQREINYDCVPMDESPEKVEVPEFKATKKRKKIKLETGIGSKRKQLCNMMEKWKNVSSLE